MNTTITAANVAILAVLIVLIARAARLHQLARQERYAALTAGLTVAWCHARMMEGWHPWDAYPPPAGMLVDMLHRPGDRSPRIMRVPEDDVPGLAMAWWRPFQARESISHIGGIA